MPQFQHYLMNLKPTCQGLTPLCLTPEQPSALLPTVILFQTGPVALMLHPLAHFSPIAQVKNQHTHEL